MFDLILCFAVRSTATFKPFKCLSLDDEPGRALEPLYAKSGYITGKGVYTII